MGFGELDVFDAYMQLLADLIWEKQRWRRLPLEARVLVRLKQVFEQDERYIDTGERILAKEVFFAGLSSALKTGKVKLNANLEKNSAVKEENGVIMIELGSLGKCFEQIDSEVTEKQAQQLRETFKKADNLYRREA